VLRRRRAAWIGGAALCAAGVVLFGGAGYIHAKAWLAQALLERAWAQRLDGASPAAARPWPWADTAPLARLQVARLGVDLIILAGASGRTLAFGPAHLDGTPVPGGRGNSVVTGHRDTHFAFLRRLQPGDALRLQSPGGDWRSYRISGSEVFDARTARLDPAADRYVVTLVTCYPFEAVAPGGPLRYAVFAESADPPVKPAQSERPARHAAHNGTGRPG
jgi:sortase A